MPVAFKNRGFTLLETIIYIGLFGLIFSGIFSSIYPILTGADRLTEYILINSEQEFMFAKITYLLGDSLTTNQTTITEPGPNATSSRLIIKDAGLEKYHLETADMDCQIPMLCTEKQILVSKDQGVPQALNNTRIIVSNLTVHRPPLQTGDLPNYLDISFKINGVAVTPVRLYLHF